MSYAYSRARDDDSDRFFKSSDLYFGQKLFAIDAIGTDHQNIIYATLSELIKQEPGWFSLGGNLYRNRRVAAFVREIRRILVFACYTLYFGDASRLDEIFLNHLRETYLALRIPIDPITKAVALLKNVTLDLVNSSVQGDCSVLVDELKDYFERVITALEIEANNVLDLMTDLNLASKSINPIQQLLERLLEDFDGSKYYVQMWLSSPHPAIGGKQPLSYLNEEDIEIVETLVEMMETGHPG